MQLQKLAQNSFKKVIKSERKIIIVFDKNYFQS